MMLRRLALRAFSSTPGSSVAEPHQMAASLNREALRLWGEGKREEATKLQETVIHIKENRGDADLDQHREELESMKEGLKKF